MALMKCRFYENQFPDVEETVVANVKMIADMGAYVRLSEYNDKGILTESCSLSQFPRFRRYDPAL